MQAGHDPNPPLRIALTLKGDPADAASWSGVPSGVSSGLKAAGCEVIPVRAEFPGAARIGHRLHMSWADQAASPAFAVASGFAAERRLRHAGRSGLDGIVMIGSGYALSTPVPLVTLEDMTVAQALRRSAPPYDSLGASGRRHWQARQLRIYEAASGCCLASEWAADSVREDYGISPDKVHVVGLGRNIDAGRPERDWGRPRFLFVGFDWERKRGADVVKAFAAVRARHPGASLGLVGGHPPIEAEGVTGHGPLPLNSPASRERYLELLERSTCLLMPSTYEPFGIAYLDAGAAGLPSIGTTVGGAPTAIGPGGRVVEPGSLEALQAAMLELADPDAARRAGDLAFQHSSLLTWNAVAQRLLRALCPQRLDSTEELAAFLAPTPADPGRGR